MSQILFVKNEKQQAWLQKLELVKDIIISNAQKNDEESAFPFESIEALREIGYTKLTLPTEYGGEGFNIYDVVVAHEKLGSFDGSTALIIAWSLLFVGDAFEQPSWTQQSVEKIAQAAQKGALFNKAVSEYAMGSPVRGGRPATNAVKKGDKWIINGRKNYTTGSHALDYFYVQAWIEEQKSVGFFLIPKDAPGLSIEETWDVRSMKSAGSHD